MDFQRGNFRDRASIDIDQLKKASVIRGTVPVIPTLNNLRLSDRVASAPHGDDNQRFFSRTTSVVTARRTPFAEQQTAVRKALENHSP
jgi:hypothetical protein